MFNIKAKVSGEYEPNITYYHNSIVLNYPICPSNHICGNYEFTLFPGRYYIECYGASGGRERGTAFTFFDPYTNSCISQNIVEQYGGNTVCSSNNTSGSGGYIGGLLTITRPTTVYAYIGGRGVYSNGNLGGFNGGGNSDPVYSAGSGGGATDLRVVRNDVFHRIIVAGGGGGSDNDRQNDGSGGAGGYPAGQGYFQSKEYHPTPIASQLYGFSFGVGESAGEKTSHPNSTSYGITNADVAGARGGWFGGFCSGHNNGGAGGGSSFVLSKDASIPSGIIKQYDDHYSNVLNEAPYAFDTNSPYVMTNIKYANGIWAGDGRMIITCISTFFKTCKTQQHHYSVFLIYLFVYK